MSRPRPAVLGIGSRAFNRPIVLHIDVVVFLEGPIIETGGLGVDVQLGMYSMATPMSIRRRSTHSHMNTVKMELENECY